MFGAALLLFPKLALGLSGFETGVVVMPLVKGDPGDTHANPAGRIRNTHKLLTTAALIMSVLLILSSLMTTMLIPHAQFEEGGEANGRALAFLAHDLLGNGFGTIYDISTITDPLVRRRVGPGRSAQHRAALPAPLRHGARAGRGPAGRWSSSSPSDLLRRHDRLQGRCRRPGRRLCHRRAGRDHLCHGGGHPRLAAAGQEAVGDRLRLGGRCSSSTRWP